MQAHQGRFRLARVSHAESPPTSNVPQLGYSSPAPSFIDFRIHPDPTPAKATRGSFEYDLGTGKYQKQWTDWAEFLLWRSQEERDKSIELRLVNTYQGAAGVYERQCRYVCSRAGTGGVKTYTKLNPAWIHKLPSKRTDCPCCLLVKQYPGTSTVLGNYSEDHNHAIGNENLRFTQIPRETKEYIAGLLRLKVSPDHILQLIHHGVYNNDDDFERDFDDTFVASRNEFIQLKDIRRIEKEIEAETVRLSPDDGLSTLRWVENLRARGHLLGWKHGIPVAWMLASNGCQPTIKYFLNVHRLRSPLTIPRYMICDFDWPEINACTEAYITCVLLCWWHVLHAWQQHLRVSTHPELWELLKRWIRITDKAEFDAAWVTTQNQEGVEDFVAYLAKYWMPEKVVRMWSAVYRTSRTIFEESNTNMLIEAYVQRRQELGFEGPDIEVQKRKDILKRSKVYVKSDIAQIDDYKFLVPSKSNPAKLYEVDLDTYTCTCLDFPLISYCKHICAVQVLF
ncbi:hypothetical protein DFH06DRAFT_1019876, partial [Mycena polygramma]